MNYDSQWISIPRYNVLNDKSTKNIPHKHPVSFSTLIGLLCCASASASAAEIPITEGMSFQSARKALLHDGWKPNPTYPGEFGVENIMRRNGFVEIESCTMGIQHCSFNYTKNRTCLGVGTVGEDVKTMKVYSWNFKCPEID